jgi:hypothetical protein
MNLCLFCRRRYLRVFRSLISPKCPSRPFHHKIFDLSTALNKQCSSGQSVAVSEVTAFPGTSGLTCFSGLDPTTVLYHDSSWILRSQAFYRDSVIEAALIAYYIQTCPHHHDVIDRRQVRALFTRFAAISSSICEDQTAFIYASLCMAADMQAHAYSELDLIADKATMQTMAVGYFRLACEDVDKWNRPSLFLLCK